MEVVDCFTGSNNILIINIVRYLCCCWFTIII